MSPWLSRCVFVEAALENQRGREYRPSGHPVTSPTHASPPSAPILVSASKLPTFGAPEHLVDLKQTGQEGEFWWARGSGLPTLSLF